MDVGARRLFNQRIAHSSFDDAAQVVEWLGAVQAQDFLASLWAIGLRLRRGAEAAVERAIAQRSIVRTWPMRGTLHFVPAADARWMLALLTPRVIASSAARHRQLELDATVLARSGAAIANLLQGGKAVTRNALYQHLEHAGISTQGSRGLHILSHHAQHGLLCFGPRAGKQPTLVLLDEWVPHPRVLPREAALALLALRYFTSHGPATIHDFAWWSGLTIRTCREAVAHAGARLVQQQLAGSICWSAADAVTTQADLQRAHLLPAFDEFTVAYRDRRAVLAAEHAARASAGGILYPVMVFDARVCGTWRRVLGPADVAINLQPFAPLKRMQLRAFEDAAERYARFLGRDLAGVQLAVKD